MRCGDLPGIELVRVIGINLEHDAGDPDVRHLVEMPNGTDLFSDGLHQAEPESLVSIGSPLKDAILDAGQILMSLLMLDQEPFTFQGPAL